MHKTLIIIAAACFVAALPGCSWIPPGSASSNIRYAPQVTTLPEAPYISPETIEWANGSYVPGERTEFYNHQSKSVTKSNFSGYGWYGGYDTNDNNMRVVLASRAGAPYVSYGPYGRSVHVVHMHFEVRGGSIPPIQLVSYAIDQFKHCPYGISYEWRRYATEPTWRNRSPEWDSKNKYDVYMDAEYQCVRVRR